MGHIEGRALSSLMAMYFRSIDGAVSRPSSVIVPTPNNGWLELEANGSGKIRSSSNFFDRVFFDAELGYSFVAPLVMAMGARYDGSQTIMKINLIENEFRTNIDITLSDKRSFVLRFEDDELYIDLA